MLFESALRAVTLLRDVLVELGDRRAAVARELTKLHEEVLRGRVSEVLASLLDSEPRGEMVIVLEGAEAPGSALAELVEEARRLVADGMRKREAAAAVARSRRGFGQRDLPRVGRGRDAARLNRRSARPFDSRAGVRRPMPSDEPRRDRDRMSMDRFELPRPPASSGSRFPPPRAWSERRRAAPSDAGDDAVSRRRRHRVRPRRSDRRRRRVGDRRGAIGPPLGSGRSHSFIGRSANGEPFRWDPCSTIRYQVDPGRVGAGSVGDVEEAVRRTSEASGLRFRFDGVVHASVDDLVGCGQLRDGEAGGLHWSPILIAFRSRRAMRGLGVRQAPRGHVPGDEPVRRRPVRERGRRDQRERALEEGFDRAPSLGTVLQHELGHAVGLGPHPRPVPADEPGAGRVGLGQGRSRGSGGTGRAARVSTSRPPSSTRPSSRFPERIDRSRGSATMARPWARTSST